MDLDDSGLKQLQQATRLRVNLESEAVREIARQPERLPLVRKKLEPFISRFKAFIAKRDYEAFNQADYALHYSIVELAQNPLLLELWQVVWETHAGLHRDRIETLWPDLRVVVNEHVYLIETVCSGDATASLEALQSHLEALLFRFKDELTTPPGDDIIGSVCAWLAYHLHQTFTLQEVAARVAFVSPVHLSRLFCQRHGVGFNAFVRRLKMDKAMHLLKHS